PASCPGANAGPPVNGGQQRSTVADHREPPPDHNRTTAGTVVWPGQVMDGSGCHVDHLESATWHEEINPHPDSNSIPLGYEPKASQETNCARQ
ncbi:hypothetical protein Tco_1170859, partial [Tanacetum coccineum]